MKSLLAAGACALALACAVPASAKQWVDYSPQKGYWEVTYVKVDPNKIDDYLTGLKATWVPGEEIAKKNGLIDDYQVMVNATPANGGANVIFCVHYLSFVSMDPDKKRDRAMDKQFEAAVPKTKSDAAVANFDKYRTFVGDDIYVPVDFAK